MKRRGPLNHTSSPPSSNGRTPTLNAEIVVRIPEGEAIYVRLQAALVQALYQRPLAAMGGTQSLDLASEPGVVLSGGEIADILQQFHCLVVGFWLLDSDQVRHFPP